jgi:type I restriction enzyme S subunit
MKYVTLKDVCTINMGQSPDSDSYNDNGEGVPFFQGNADFGERYPVTRKWCSAPTKMAAPEDILISVRAPIGAMNYAKEECCIGRGLAALTPDKTKVSPKFIFWLLKGKNAELNSKGTGSTFKAIGRKVLEETKVPDISLEKQLEHSETLEKIYAVIQHRKSELQMLDDLIKARFVEMFGDPVSNSNGLPESTLPELGEFGRGISKHRPRNDPKLLGGDYPLIQTGDVANAGLYITSYSSTYSELGLKQSKMWDNGTLCITIAANIAKTSILKFDACFPDSIVGFNANEKTNNIFIHYWFSFFQAILESQAPESAQKNINLKTLSELKVIVPVKDKQDKFVEFIKQVDKSKVAVQKALDETQMLFDSLMQKYFG